MIVNEQDYIGKVMYISSINKLFPNSYVAVDRTEDNERAKLIAVSKTQKELTPVLLDYVNKYGRKLSVHYTTEQHMNLMGSSLHFGV